MIELHTLGALELTSDAGTPLGAVLAQPRRTALLCYLALARPRGFQRRDTLYALFWPEHDADRARHALRQSLYFLRRSLGAVAIVSRGDDELALAPDVFRCDAAEFERAVDEGRLEDALALYRGDLLVGFHTDDAPDFERWLDDERTHLRQRAAGAAWALAEARERDGDPSAGAAWGRRAAALGSPTDESAVRRLILLLDRLGDRAAAVRAYEAFARQLEQEYELKPSAETSQLVSRLRAGEERSAASVTAAAAARPPEMPRGSQQTAQDAGARQAADGVERAAADTQPQPRSGSVERRRPRRRSGSRLVGLGALLIALLGAGTWWLTLYAREEETPAAPGSARERIIVADFTDRTSDSAYGSLVALVLRTELARSPRLTVLGQQTIADVLRRMRRPPGTALSAEVAREVALREKIKAVVSGEIRAAGTGLVLTASAIEAASGDLIYGASETVRDSTEILPAIERLSNGIRKGIGESITSIRRGDSLWSFTTSSLPALRKHVAAIAARGRGDYLTAVDLLGEAIALDLDFAHAYVSLAGQVEFAGLPRGRVARGLVHAYQLRDRLTERERYAVEGFYHLDVTGDATKAIAALRRHVEVLKQIGGGEPGWTSALATTLARNGELAAADRVLDESQRLFPTATTSPAIQVEVRYALGKDAEAGQVLDRLKGCCADHPRTLHLEVALLADSGRYEAAHALAARIRRESSLRNDLRVQAELDAVRGRYGEAVEHLRALRDQALARSELGAAVEIAAAAGRLRFLAGDSAGAAEVETLLARHPLDSLDVLSRPYLPLALFYAEAGQPRRARAWLDAYEREFPQQFRGPDRWMLHRTRAAAYRAEGNAAQALAELREAARSPALRVGLFDEPLIRTGDHPELARTYEASGMADSAVAVYERYLAARVLSRTTTDAFELGRALEGLSALYEGRGEQARAAALRNRLPSLRRGGADAPARAPISP